MTPGRPSAGGRFLFFSYLLLYFLSIRDTLRSEDTTFKIVRGGGDTERRSNVGVVVFQCQSV